MWNYAPRDVSGLNETLNTQDVNSQRKRRRGGQFIYPVFVRHILSSSEKDFKVFGTPVQLVSLVGILRKCQVENIGTVCEIEDFSGNIKGIIPVDSNIDTSLVEVNHYVQVFGTVRFQDGVQTVAILKLVPVDDINLITCHGLHVICTRLEAENDFKKQLMSANTTATTLTNALINEDGEIPTTSVSGLTTLQQEIYNIVKSEYLSDGIMKENILKQYPAYQAPEVIQALLFLINKGLIYNASPGHFKAVSNS